MLIPTLETLKFAMNNPFSQCVLRYGSKFCKECSESRLEHALEIFSGTSHPFKNCKTYSFLVKMLIKSGGRIFGVNEESQFREYFMDPTVRRGLTSVLRGIAKYGITKPQLLDAPFLVVWNFTNACNLNCKHCYQSAGERASDELTTEERLRAVEEMEKSGVVAIAFSGGEPLMSRDFFEVATKAKERGMYVALATNGTLITEKIAKKLKDVGVDYVEISLDSSNPERHDAFRGIPGSFDRTLRGIRNCIDEGIFTCVATTVTKVNLYEIPEIIDLAEKLGAKRFMAFNFVPAGRAEDAVDLDLTPEQREDLLRYLFMQNGTRKIQILSTAPQFARVSLELSGGKIVAPTHMYIGQAYWGLKTLAEFIGGCGAGRLYCALQPNGDVSPCVFMPGVMVGNVRKTPFMDIFHQSEVMEKLRDRSLLKGNCGTCQYRYVCGGCRARAFGYFRELSAPDPGCVRNNEHNSKAERKAVPIVIKMEDTILKRS